MYNEKIEQLIKAALADGVLTEKEKQVLFKRAQEHGIDLDEFEMVLDARLVELQKAEQEKREKSAPKSDKYGDVRKCPACGAIVGAFKGACPECGYEFSNVDANLSSKKLYDTLAKETSTQKKKEIIETFPLPNTKADLLEFLTALKPRIQDVSDAYSGAYLKKYAECIEKVKVAFANDKMLAPFIVDFDRIQDKINQKKRKEKTMAGIKRVSKLLYLLPIVILIALPIYSNRIQENKLEECSSLIDQGQADNAAALLATVKLKKKNFGRFSNLQVRLVEFYVSKDDMKKAEQIFYSHRPKKPNDALTFSQRTNSESSIHATLKEGYIRVGDYDKAWNHHPISRFYDRNTGSSADEYYKFMSDVVRHLCKQGRKQDAIKFVNEYSLWFEENVDSSNYYRNEYWGGDLYTYRKAKARLLQSINTY